MKQNLGYILIIFLLMSFSSEGQCFPDRHSTTWYDGWVSCSESQNPNSSRGVSHWIMYDLGKVYSLAETKLWNANEPENLGNGIQEYALDYSIDGVSWETLGSYTLDQASGLSTYEGVDGPDFEDNFARYVILTPLSNYGGDCYGFSELKINVGEENFEIDEEDGFSAIVYPNPFRDELNIKIVTLHDGTPIKYEMYDMIGREILREEILEASVINNIDLGKLNIGTGFYILNLEHNGKEKSFKLVKE